MTISSTTRKAGPFFGNGATTDFPFSFKVFKKQDLLVTLTDPSGADQLLILDSAYSVTLNSDQDANPGGSIHYPLAGPPLAASWRLTVTGALPNTQPTDIQNSGGFFPQIVEDMGDRSTIQIQQLQEQVDRSVKFSVSDPGVGTTLPPADVRANKVLAFDANGTPITVAPVDGSAAEVAIALQSFINAIAGVGGSALVGYKSDAPGAVLQTVKGALDTTVTPYTFGAVGDGVADDTAAMLAFGQAQARKKFIAPGRFRVTQEIVFRPGDLVEGAGALSVIDASGAALWPFASVVRVSGALTQVADLSSNVNAGDDSLSLTSTAGVSAGNALILYNPTDFSWSGWRAEYRAGEFVRVHSVSGVNVKLMAALYDSYNAVAMDVYRIDGASTVFRNFSVLAPALEIIGVKMAMIDRPVMENVWCTGALGTSLEFERCADIRFDGSAFQTQPSTNDEYGVALANCHGGMVLGASLNAGRHGLAIGGYDRIGCVPNRAITVQVARMGNNAPAGSQDMHGNAEDFRFFGGTFHNGGVIGGQNHKFFGCRFVGRQSGNGVALYAGELRGGTFEFSACTFEALTNPNAGGYGVVSLGNLTANTRAACKFIFNDCAFKAPGSTGYAVGLAINGAIFSPTVLFHNVDLEAAGLTQFLRMSRDAGVSTVARVTIQGIYNLAAGAAYVVNAGTSLSVSRYSLPRQGGVVTVAGVPSANNASASVQFNHPYPVAPQAFSYKANGTTLGGVSFIPDVQGVTGTAMTVNATTASGANYPNSTTGTIGWEAFIDQH